ncbi:Phospholipid phosphatase [Dirofilaria immitis]
MESMQESVREVDKISLQKKIMLGSFFLNLLIGLIIGLSIEFVPKLYFEPYHRGFYCNDPTIQLPYKASTIPTSILFVFILLLPLIGFIITEAYRSKYWKELYSWRDFNFNQILVNCSKYYAYHLLGILLTLLLTIPTKFIVGELRPIFMDICNPLYDNIYCHNHTYIMDYKCRGNKYNHTVKEARLSFFSGHASLAMTTAIFFIIYIQSRIPPKSLAIIAKPLIQLFAFGLALYTGYSRITDGMHHLHDIIVGYIVGALIGYVTGKYIAGLEIKPNKCDEMKQEIARNLFSSELELKQTN